MPPIAIHRVTMLDLNVRPRPWPFAGERFSACYFHADFASFLAWRDWGFPDRGVFDGCGMGALRCSDGAFVLGEMGHHTANAGRIYFPSGTPDPDDIRDGAYWDCVVSGAAIAMIRMLNVDVKGEELRARIEANLARQDQPELSAIH